MGNNPEHREFAQKIKEKLGLRIVALQHMDEYVAGDGEYVDKVLYDIDPSQFVALIRDAELILTDSFHGTIFAILFNKPFAVFQRVATEKGNVMGGRINALLKKL